MNKFATYSRVKKVRQNMSCMEMMRNCGVADLDSRFLIHTSLLVACTVTFASNRTDNGLEIESEKCDDSL